MGLKYSDICCEAEGDGKGADDKTGDDLDGMCDWLGEVLIDASDDKLLELWNIDDAVDCCGELLCGYAGRWCWSNMVSLNLRESIWIVLIARG